MKDVKLDFVASIPEGKFCIEKGVPCSLLMDEVFFADRVFLCVYDSVLAGSSLGLEDDEKERPIKSKNCPNC